MRVLLVGTLLMGLSLAYQQVVRAAAPDPSIVYAGGYYHMTYTSADHIEMVRSKTLRGLLIGKVRTVYSETNSTRASNIVRKSFDAHAQLQDRLLLPHNT